MKDPNYFETQIPKQDDYRMTKDLDPSLRETIKTIQGFDSDEQLDKHLDDVINNCNLHVFFDIIENEFNQYLNCNHKFVFSTWHNKFHLECQQHENQIFMSSSFVASLLCYYAYILYQADNVNNVKYQINQRMDEKYQYIFYNNNAKKSAKSTNCDKSGKRVKMPSLTYSIVTLFFILEFAIVSIVLVIVIC